MPILDWLTRAVDVQAADAVEYRLLEEEPSLSYGDGDSGNMLIHGDNLDALKSLLPFYAGQVKCIFIDPPYNTKSAFEHYDDNLEHSQWLAMMYPRLQILHELLADDGTIWVILDDNESHYLKIIMDEIFGRKNFVANAIWQKKYAPANDAKYLSDNHDHIFCYAKNKPLWKRNLLPRDEKSIVRYKNPDDDPRGVWKSSDCSAKRETPKDIYPITTPSGRVVNPPAGRSWMFNKEKFAELIADNRIYFGKDGNNVPAHKRFLSEVQDGLVSLTIWTYAEVGHNQEAKKEVKKFNAINVFDTPKPERLIERVLHLASNKGDLILDSFAGSGTTAAVAHKMKRRWITIERGEHAKTHCVPRLKQVIDGTDKGGITESAKWQGGGGFRFYNLGDTVFDEMGNIHEGIRFETLASHIWFLETQTPRKKQTRNSLIGIHKGQAYALLYNGILGDKRPDGGNVLTTATLKIIQEEITKIDSNFHGEIIIYGEQSRFGNETLKQKGITFKQTPYDVKKGR